MVCLILYPSSGVANSFLVICVNAMVFGVVFNLFDPLKAEKGKGILI